MGSGFIAEDGISFVSIKEDDGNENTEVNLDDLKGRNQTLKL